MILIFIIRIFSRTLFLIPLSRFQDIRSDAKTCQEAHESYAAEDTPG
jgi:hypothetical protein